MSKGTDFLGFTTKPSIWVIIRRTRRAISCYLTHSDDDFPSGWLHQAVLLWSRLVADKHLGSSAQVRLHLLRVPILQQSVLHKTVDQSQNVQHVQI